MQLVLENKSEAGNCDDRKFISKSSDRFENMSSENIAVMKDNEFVESLSLGNGDVDFNDTLEKVGSTLDDILTKEFLTDESVENHKTTSSLPVQENSKSPNPSIVQNVTVSQENHVTSNESDALPIANEIVPEENDVTSQEKENLPQEKEIVSQENEITPQEEEILLNKPDASSDENDVSAKENNAICPQVPVDEDDSIAKIDDIPSKLITDDDTANTNSKMSDTSIAELLSEDDNKVQSTDSPTKLEETIDIKDSDKITESEESDSVEKKEKDEGNATEVAEKPAETSSEVEEEPRDELEDMLNEIVNGCPRKSPVTADVVDESKMDVVDSKKAEDSIRKDESIPAVDKDDNLDSDVEMTDCSIETAVEKKSPPEDNLPDDAEARKSDAEVSECKAPKEEVVENIIDDVEPMEVDGALPIGDVATKNAENTKESKQASPPLANDAMVFIAHPDIDFTELKKEKNIDDGSVSTDLIGSEKIVPTEVILDNEDDIVSSNMPSTISNGHKAEVLKNDEPCKNDQKSTEKSLVTNTPNIEMQSKNSSVVIDSLEVLSDDEMSDNHKTVDKAVKSPKADEKSDAKSVECVSLDDDDDLMMISNVKDKEKPSDMAVLEKNFSKVSAIFKENEESELAKSEDKTNSLIVLDDDDCGVTKKLEPSKSDIDITNPPNDTSDMTKNDEKKSEGETIVIEEESTKKENSNVTPDKLEPEEDKIVFEELPDAKVEDIKITPILPLNFMTTFKPTLEKMSREDLEEYCLVKIVEAIAKRSKLSVVENELKAQAKHMEMLRKTLAGVTKQNRDLEVVMKNLTNEHKKRRTEIIEPVKISRSVGFQVGNSSLRPKSIKPLAPSQPNYEYKEQSNNIVKNISQVNKPQKPVPTVNHQSLPPVANTSSSDSNAMPRKILHPSRHRPQLPARPPVKPPVKSSPTSATTKTLNHLNNVNTKSAEKRPSETSIDLTDDEPPTKLPAINNSQTKISRVSNTNANNATPSAPNRITYTMKDNSPANNNFSKSIVFTSKPSPNQQQAAVTVSPVTNNNPPVVNIKVGIPIKPNVTSNQRAPTQLLYSRHPAPLPATPKLKQASNPNWKWLPPRPELKISRVSNGIVISWIMDIPMDSRYEDIASYQIYAYQETSTPPQTELWKKIGDVKALPLPMACTLTQFMVGYKYFFAVRAVDVKSRVGQFSTPGYILLNREK